MKLMVSGFSMVTVMSSMLLSSCERVTKSTAPSGIQHADLAPHLPEETVQSDDLMARVAGTRREDTDEQAGTRRTCCGGPTGRANGLPGARRGGGRHGAAAEAATAGAPQPAESGARGLRAYRLYAGARALPSALGAGRADAAVPAPGTWRLAGALQPQRGRCRHRRAGRSGLVPVQPGRV